MARISHTKSFTANIILFLVSLLNTSLVLNQSGVLFAADINQYPQSAFMLTNSTLGKEFWIAIPKNDSYDSPRKEIGIEVVVTSFKNCTVNLEIPGIGKQVTKKVDAFKLTTFSSKKGEVPFSMEILEAESEKVTQKGIHLTADAPISVEVVTCKEYSGEGFHAIPIDAWGMEYYHCAYYDWFSKQSPMEDNRERAGGFIIISKEDATSVTIKLNGKGKELAKTYGGRKIGDTWTVSLRKGETYMVQGDGKTLGVFDITGTQITSTKPIGLISYHMRCMVPSFAPEDRDNLCEMIPPTNQWGKQFVTVSFDRKPSGNAKGKGDLFRVVAKENNTHYKVQYWDKKGVFIGQSERDLNAGEFAEILDIQRIENNNTQNSVYDVAFWSANKPILLLQYAFSNPFDNDTKWAPLNVAVVPIEQYVNRAIFQTPEELNFNENEFTILAIGDPDDPESTLLKSIKVDGEPLYIKSGSLLGNRASGTNIYWTRVFLPIGAHKIEADTKIFGYVNGFAPYNAYGYPTGQGTVKIDEFDELAPQFKVTEDCGIYTIEATEKRTGTPDPDQKDQGLQNIFLIEEASNNFSFEMVSPEKFKPQSKITSQKFILTPIDRLIPGKAVFAAIDRANNYSIDSVEFTPDSITFSANSLDFGKVRLNLKKIITFEILNIGTKPLNFDGLSFKKATVFKLVDTVFAKGFTVPPEQTQFIDLSYTPTTENIANSDTLIATGECATYTFYVIGIGVQPHVQAADFDFGKIEMRTETCANDGIEIKNIGTDTVRVTGIESVESPFSLKEANPDFPFSIAPNGKVKFKLICFFPQDSLKYENDVTLVTDYTPGETDDIVIHLEGEAFKKPNGVGDDDVKTSELQIIPNPVYNGSFIIKSSDLFEKSNVLIGIYDINGIPVYKSQSTINSEQSIIHVSTSGFSTGVYYLKAVSGSSVVVKKLLIIK